MGNEVIQDYRAVFISDTHLGFKGSKASHLASFLESHHSDHLYLVGDIVDAWRMNRKVYWPELHTRIVRNLMAKSTNGTTVHYIVGNHDEMLRGWLDQGFRFGNVKFSNETDYYGIDGNRYLVIHGDLFDGLMHNNVGRGLMMLGTRLYDSLLTVDTMTNRVLGIFNIPRKSLTGFAKRQTKAAVGYVLKFEALLSEHAKEHEYDGVICGHIHTPEIKDIGDTRYMNCGDWVENCTALVEHHDGTWELVKWKASV